MKEETLARVYAFICRYVGEHGLSPSLQEIADGVGLSKTTASTSIEFLEAQGKITHQPGKVRTVLLLR
jgi:SOS-response transcriptional repressor LexA